MPTQPRSPSEHYVESERLLAVAESTGTDPAVQSVAALTAVGHALLALSPRRARKRPAESGRHTPGDSPRDRWLSGRDDLDGQS